MLVAFAWSTRNYAVVCEKRREEKKRRKEEKRPRV
tara:strand:- start:156 stop:260 length:105 start_codon:yes stop_codon:yes gene_type:complete